MENNLKLGSHVGMNKSNNYLIGTANEIISYAGNALMFYTGAPQNKLRTNINNLYIDDFHKILKENNISLENAIVHAPYLINLANTSKEYMFDFSLEFLESEIVRTEAIGAKIMVLHPGSASEIKNLNLSLSNLILGLNKIFSNHKIVKIALETMSGKGNQLGSNFDQLSYIISKIEFPAQIGVCWDTCHLWDAGYDLINNLDLIINEFDKKIGLDKLLCIHLNDSLNPLNSKKDRHANIGYGYIGFEPLKRILYHPLLMNVPKILETPYVSGNSPYKQEILMLKNGVFTNPFPNLKKINNKY